MAPLGLLFVLLTSPANIGATRAEMVERNILVEINRVRANPSSYSEVLTTYRAGFVGDVAYVKGDPDGVDTEEGVSAVDEAITFVKKVGSERELEWDPALALAARVHAEEQQSSGTVGHASSTGESFEQRMKPLTGRPIVEEVISYGESDTSAVVRQLIVDDGVDGRGHRKIVFDPRVSHAGVACRPHPVYGVSCVIDVSAD